jgi:uncharacterized protein (TIGR04255 family)
MVKTNGIMPDARPKYTKPPIQEAVFEVHYDLAQPLSKESIESLKPVWQEGYPDQKTVAEKNFKLELGPEGIKTSEYGLGNKLICRTTDGKRLVQLSSLLLAVNQLSPYPGWDESFRDTIQHRAEDVQKTIGPLPFRQVALRYINKIDIPEVPLIWENWFQFHLPLPKLEGAGPPRFQMQFDMGITDSCRLTVNAVALPATPSGTSSVILDIVVAWMGPPTDPRLLSEYMEKVHRPHRLAFEGYLNDNLRRLFY